MIQRTMCQDSGVGFWNALLEIREVISRIVFVYRQNEV